MNMFAEVALPLPVPHTFTYCVPQEMQKTLSVGHRALVPFGTRRLAGYLVEIGCGQEREDLKSILEILDECPLFPASMIPFFKWISDYYFYPLGMVIKTALPAGLKVKAAPVFVLNSPIPDNKDFLNMAEAEQAVLTAIKQGKTVSSHLPFPGLTKRKFLDALKSLEGKKYICKRIWIQQRGLVPRYMKFVHAVELNPQDRTRLTPRQREVLEYVEALGSVSLKEMAIALPGSGQVIRRMEKKGLLITVLHRVHRTPFGEEISLESKPPMLTPDQERIFRKLEQAIDERTYRPFVLHGVTGSGKTEIYMRAIAHALAQGLSVLVLVPEISLSLSMEGLFRARFGHDMALIHSGLSPGEAYDQWITIASGRVRLVLGARSAVFAPLDHPALIIVDEEHDPSYKQDDRLRYNARDLALMRAKMADGVVILGSATPSFRTYRNAVSGKIAYLSLPQRVLNRPQPKVEMVDMRQEPQKRYLTRTLISAVQENLKRREQTLLFLNRRGYSPIVLCLACGNTVGCPSCHISVTYHRTSDRLVCHYCGHQQSLIKSCPVCGRSPLIPMGWGTEKLEKETQDLFPQARIARMDSDTASGRRELVQLLKDLRQGEIDILVGTQMITKGHDFPNVTLVGVLAADQSMHFPDFGAAERTFQLLAQVSGRAGRGIKPGRVIIQTFNPEHYSLVQAREHNFHGFYLEEIVKRSQLGYPPFSRLIMFRISGESAQETGRVAHLVGGAVKSALQKSRSWGRILGPAPAPISRLRGKYRWQVMFMGKSASETHLVARDALEILAGSPAHRGVEVAVDVDAITTM
jgi:primosomal protein N' (replication factor Y)